MVELKNYHRRFCYGWKKGMKKYPESIRNEIRQKQENGQSVKSLSKEYGISRWAIQTWCGLSKDHERVPKARGRKPAKTLQEYSMKIND